MAKPSEKRLTHFREMVAYDKAIVGFGTSLAGMDEVGRGPLFGSVVTACVIMPADPPAWSECPLHEEEIWTCVHTWGTGRG